MLRPARYRRLPRFIRKLRMHGIAVRLIVSFAVIIGLMATGSSYALWQINRVEQQVHRIDTLDQTLYGILGADNAMVRFAEELREALEERNSQRFNAAADKIEQRAQLAVATADRAVSISPGFGEPAYGITVHLCLLALSFA